MKKTILATIFSLLIGYLCYAQNATQKLEAQFPGGQSAFGDFIEQQLCCSDNALDDCEEAIVYVKFAIDAAGQIIPSKTQIAAGANEIGKKTQAKIITAFNNSPPWNILGDIPSNQNMMFSRVMPLQLNPNRLSDMQKEHKKDLRRKKREAKRKAKNN